jgi:radical SAM protein with 4Fe4S-binding SPASM domain
MELFQQIVDEISTYSFYLTLYFQGEPLMHPQIGAMIAYAKSKKMFVFTSTNGHFLTAKNAKIVVESKLDKLVVSLDGATQADYEQYRVGGDFNRVIEGIKTLSAVRSELKSKVPLIVAQVLLLKTTENHVSQIQEIALNSGCDAVELKKAQFYHPNNESSLLPQNPNYLRYKYHEKLGWQPINKGKVGCNRLWNSLVITWDGKILPCCYDKDATHIMGTLESTSVYSAFHSKEAKQFRKEVFTNKSSIEICSNCGE